MNGLFYGLNIVTAIGFGIFTLGMLIWMTDNPRVNRRHKLIVIASACIFGMILSMFSVTYTNWNAQRSAKESELHSNGVEFGYSSPGYNQPYACQKFIFEDGKDLVIYRIY